MISSLRAIAIAAVLVTQATAVHAIDWTMIPDSSTLRFQGTQTGQAFNGQFRRFDAQITLDPEDLSDASIVATIDIASFASGSPDRDSDALTGGWFNSRQFPQATFTSSAVTHVEGNSYLAVGTLAIKDVQREVQLPFTLDIAGDQAVADGTIELNRMEYGVTGGGENEDDSFVGHAVNVSFHIVATKAE